MAAYTFRDLTFTCEEWQKINGRCPYTNGKEVLDLYKLNVNPEMNLMALGICAIVYRFMAYVVLKVVKERWIGKAWRKMGGGKRAMEKTDSAQDSSGVTRPA